MGPLPTPNMASYTITVDDQGYCGESPDETDGTQNTGLGNNFHNYSSGERSTLLWGHTPMVIETAINLKSHLDRIMDRVRYNRLEPTEITIRRVEP